MKPILLLTGLFLLSFSVFAQIQPAGVAVRDDLSAGRVSGPENAKRSAQNPKACSSDTVEYPYNKASGLVTISIAKGRGLGQLYSCPKTVTVSGFTFYAFVLPSHKTAKKMQIFARLYKAGSDSLPSGAPLRADTLQIDSTLGAGYLSVIKKQAFFAPISLDSNYILAIETSDDTLTAGLVTNSYTARDGESEYLNCGSISGLWYRGRNLNVGGNPFDADILLHPYVKYNFGTDFSIKNNCYTLSDSIRFINAAPQNMAGSRMYNRYMLYNLGYICHLWDLGNGSGSQYTVDHKIKYSVKQNYRVRLISRVYGYNGPMANGCIDTTIKTLYFKPDIPTFTGNTNACIGDSVKFTAVSSDTGVVFEWFSKNNLNTPVLTGKTFTRNPVTAPDTIYLRASNNGCASGFRAIYLKANAYPKVLNVLNDSVCAGSRANLKATADIGTIQWFSSASGGAPFFSGEVYQTPVLSRDTIFYVQSSNNGCVLSPRTPVRALVGSSFAPSAPLVSADTTVCLSSGVPVQLSASADPGLTVRWFTAASGGSSISSGNSFQFTPQKRETVTFYADAFNGVCGSTRVPVNITVEHYPAAQNAYGDVVCKGDSAHLGFTLPYGEADWYDASTGGNLLGSGTAYVFLPGSNTDLYVETRSGVCVSPVRFSLSATVNTYPSLSKLWGDTICAKNSATLRAVYSGAGIVDWFDSDTSSTVLGSGSSFLTPVLNGTRKYFARPSYAGCTGPRTAVQPTVKPGPFSGFSFEVLSWQQVRVSPINASGCAVKWDFGDGFTSNSNSVTHRYQDTGTYKIKLILTSILNGCKDSTTVTVQIQMSNLFAPELKPGLSVYPNPGSGLFVLEDADRYTGLRLRVSDVRGAVLLNTTAGAEPLDLRTLPSGVYVLQVDGYKPVLISKL